MKQIASSVITFTLALSLVTLAHAEEDAVGTQTVMIPMRDGVKLHSTLYDTGSPDKPRPVLLLRLPYDQPHFIDQARRLAKENYIAIIQHCRGRLKSEGHFGFYWGEGDDGFDAVIWIRRQPWSDGRVGMWGPSYMGSSQWLAAGAGTPLTVAAPTASALNFYYNVYLGGAYMLPHARAGFSIDLFGPPTDIGSSPKWREWYMHLPLADWDKVIGRKVPWQMSMIRHYRPDGFWNGADVTGDVPRMDFPAQHIVGYYDFMCRESVRGFQLMCKHSASEFSRANQQLILGPWEHSTGHRFAGEIDFGPKAEVDVLAENIHWFDRFLKTPPARRKPFPNVRYFSMGENRWYEASTWPPEYAAEKSWYLHSDGHANTRTGDGSLSTTRPVADEPADQFQSDPANPVPCWPEKGKEYRDVWGPVDQAPGQDRPDVLVYQTPPLRRPLRIAGSPRMDLYVAADAPDADWVVKLIDVRPDGYAHPLATGIRRGSARDSELHRSPLEPGKHYRIEVELGHTAALLDAGHRLCIQIAGSSFPHFERNKHTGEGPEGKETRVALEQVFHSRQEPSRLILPVVEHISK